jgi:catechol 2,3-dioxygenase-like lactoylglutathione lyase family enzyme
MSAAAHKWLLRASTALMSTPGRAPVSFSRGHGLSSRIGWKEGPGGPVQRRVRDRATSQKWFEVFFGRPADEVIGEEYLWQVGANAWVVIDDRSVRAAQVGGAMITLGVTDLSDILARLAAHGIEHEPVETYGNGVRHVEVLDPDGNSLSLAEVPAR